MFILGLCVLAALSSVSGEAVRVEFEIRNLTNSGGLLVNGKAKCDTIGDCDPRLTGYIDAVTPMGSWPGSQNETTFKQILEVTDKNNVDVKKIITRDVCGSAPYTKANFRILVVDVDPFGTEEIGKFMCYSGRAVARNEKESQWSRAANCDSIPPTLKTTLQFSWRAFEIPQSMCGGSPVDSVTAKPASKGGKVFKR